MERNYVTVTLSIAYSLDQRFSTCGPRTPGGPLGASKGSAGTPEKLETRRIFTKQKYRPYQCCRYRLQRTELKTMQSRLVSNLNKTCSGPTRSTKGWSRCTLGRVVRHLSLEFLWGPQSDKGWKLRLRPQRRRISSTNSVEFSWRQSRRPTSHCATEFAPSHLISSFSMQPLEKNPLIRKCW